MDTTTTTTEAPMTGTPIPDLSDELMAGRKYPTRFPTQPMNHETASVLIEAIRQWWLDAAAGYADLADAARGAEDFTGCDEALADGRKAFAAAEHFTLVGAGERS